MIVLQQRQNHIGRIQLYLGNNGRRHAEARGTLQCVGVSTVADYKADMVALGALEVLDDILTVGAAARHEDGDIHDE